MPVIISYYLTKFTCIYSNRFNPYNNQTKPIVSLCPKKNISTYYYIPGKQREDYLILGPPESSVE